MVSSKKDKKYHSQKKNLIFFNPLIKAKYLLVGIFKQ